MNDDNDSRPDRSDRPERPDGPARPDRPDRPERPERPDRPDSPEEPQRGKPGGSLAQQLGRYAARSLPPRDQPRGLLGETPSAGRDLALECERRDITLDQEQRRYLVSDYWSPEVAEQMMSLIEACERAGVTFDLDFDHVDGEQVQMQGVTIRMRGH